MEVKKKGNTTPTDEILLGTNQNNFFQIGITAVLAIVSC